MVVRLACCGLAVLLLSSGCGRRGPPLPPLQVDPEPPSLLPLREEGGKVVVRWFAPRLADDGSPEDLRLSKAIVSYRLFELDVLAATQRAAARAPDEPQATDPDAEDPAEVPDEGGSELAAPELSDAGVEAASSEPAAAADAEVDEEAPSAGPGMDAGTEPGMDPEPALERPEPAAAPPADPGATPAPAGQPEPGQPEPAQPESAQPDPEQQNPGDPDQPEPTDQSGGPGPGETGIAPEDAEASPASEPAPTPADEPAPEPEPEGIQIAFGELEFETLAEVESELRGEEKTLELPVEPGWIGRRIEVRVRYEARGGASEESETRSLDIAGPLPAVGGLVAEVGPEAITVRWPDPRAGLGTATELSDPVFEVFRRRGGESERLGRSSGLTLADTEFIWGEEVCYRARLTLAGSEAERVLTDPGPETPPPADGDPAPGPEPQPPAGAEPGPGTPPPADDDPGDPDTAVTPGADAAAPVAAPVTAGLEEPWRPIPVRVPGAGAEARSIGPTSAEVCVTPVDTFPPEPPSDLRLFWQQDRTELSWRESESDDVAGYHIYRSDPDGAGLARLTLAPLEATGFTDTERDPRAAYRYAVSAVDSADPPNESPQSEDRRVVPR